MTMCFFFNLKSDRNSDTVERPSVTLSEISITIPEVTSCPELKKNNFVNLQGDQRSQYVNLQDRYLLKVSL